MNKGRLILIPNVIAEDTDARVLPPQHYELVKMIKHFLVEDARTARRFLSRLKIFETIEALELSVLNKDTTAEELSEMAKPLLAGQDIGIISESGCPGIADPGALAVRFAHEHAIDVVPLVGPSSIFLALMASGLNGQKFCFHGYLPVDGRECEKAIKALELESRQKSQTQIFIETPYRNNQLFQRLVKTLSQDAHLCVAVELTGKSETIRTKKVKQWRAQPFEIPKSPAVFLVLA